MTASQPAVPDELVERFAEVAIIEDETTDHLAWKLRIRDGLAAVADDLRAEGRRECAAELDAEISPWTDPGDAVSKHRLAALRDRWRSR